jgi:hypothetical protein
MTPIDGRTIGSTARFRPMKAISCLCTTERQDRGRRRKRAARTDQMSVKLPSRVTMLRARWYADSSGRGENLRRKAPALAHFFADTPRLIR